MLDFTFEPHKREMIETLKSFIEIESVKKRKRSQHAVWQRDF